MNSAREQIRDKQVDINWTNIIWDHLCAPKMSTCLLLAILNRLSTKDRIFKQNSSIDRLCALCLTHHEDRDHLFFKCIYSNQILADIMHKLNINTDSAFGISQILEIRCQHQQNSALHKHIMSITLTTMICHIWGERNSRIFKGIEMLAQLRNKLIILDRNYLIQCRMDYKKICREVSLS